MLPLPRRWPYKHLIRFVNDPLRKDDWEAKLKLADLWQAPDLPVDANTWEETIAELQKSNWKLPKVHERVPDFATVQRLQKGLARRLEDLAKSKPPRIEAEKKLRGRMRAGIGGYLHSLSLSDSAEKGRVAKVYASGAVEFDDAGDGLEFLADALQRELETGGYQFGGRGGRQWTIPPLHLSICECGCGQFFLWEGSGIRKRRKYFNDKHRMDFHNARNVEKKKLLARRRRDAGIEGYFK